MPVLPSWLLEPLWDQFSALLPPRPTYDPAHPLGCHRRRIADRIVFEKLLQVCRFGCSYEAIADSTCGATTIWNRRDEWIRAGIFAGLVKIAREAYDRIVGLLLQDIAVDGCITFRGSIARPARAPVNASPRPSRNATHDSGSLRVASPSTWSSSISSSVPVYPGAPMIESPTRAAHKSRRRP